MRVAGRDALKMTTPIMPLNQPVRCVLPVGDEDEGRGAVME